MAFELVPGGQEAANREKFNGKSITASANQAKPKTGEECSWSHWKPLRGEWFEMRLEEEAEGKVLSWTFSTVMGRY